MPTDIENMPLSAKVEMFIAFAKADNRRMMNAMAIMIAQHPTTSLDDLMQKVRARAALHHGDIREEQLLAILEPDTPPDERLNAVIIKDALALLTSVPATCNA